MLGKVFKYEFMALARKLIFVLIVTAVVSFGLGCFLRTALESGTEGFELDCNSASGFEALYILIVSILFLFITASTIEKRFEKSLLGNEGYLTNSLPVKFGVQLWGRWLSGMSWILIMAAGVAISTLFFIIPLWKYVINTPTFFTVNFYTNQSWKIATLEISTYLFFFVSWIITFAFMIEAVSSISSNHKKLLSTVVTIIGILLFLFIKVNFIYDNSIFDDKSIFMLIISNIVNVIISGANLGITYYLLGKKLDLE